MNHRMKLGYTIMGAVIMLIGIAVGLIVSPPLIAQSKGVFDEVRCSKLMVYNEHGTRAIRLAALETGNMVTIYDDKGKPAIHLAALETTNNVTVHDSDQRKASIAIADDSGRYAVHLAAGETRNRVTVYNQLGKPAIGLYADEFGNNVSVYDKTEVKWRSP